MHAFPNRRTVFSPNRLSSERTSVPSTEMISFCRSVDVLTGRASNRMKQEEGAKWL